MHDTLRAVPYMLSFFACFAFSELDSSNSQTDHQVRKHDNLAKTLEIKVVDVKQLFCMDELRGTRFVGQVFFIQIHNVFIGIMQSCVQPLVVPNSF